MDFKRRRPALAAFLSFLTLGLGQLYNGQLERALAFYVVEFIALGILLSGFLFSGVGIVVLYVLIPVYISFKGYAVVDAFRQARRIGDLELHSFNRWYIYAVWLLLPIGIQTSVANPAKNYFNSSTSMMPTLVVGDYLLADREAYQEHLPERGDVVVFKLPKAPETVFIMRIVGLSGDKVLIRRGILQINDQPVGRKEAAPFETKGLYGNPISVPRFVEILPNGRRHSILEDSDKGPLDNTTSYTVPDGNYFMLGDYRDRSRDSRLPSVGFIPKEYVIGRAEVILFSQDASAEWWQFWRWPDTVRFNRIGMPIE